MTPRGNPLSIEAVQDDFDLDWLDERLKELDRQITAANDARRSWLDKQSKLLSQRYGDRPEKNIPWPGCHNDCWPITDPSIRRWRPGMANLVLRQEPVVQFLARNPAHVDSSRSAQEFYHWLFMTHMENTPFEILELVDMIGQHGCGYTRQGWLYRTEQQSRIVRSEAIFPEGIEPAYNALLEQIAQIQRSGEQAPEVPDVSQFVAQVLIEQYRIDPVTAADEIAQAALGLLNGSKSVRLIYRAVVADRPNFEAISPLHVIRPVRSTMLEDDQFVAISHRMTQDQIQGMVADGYFPAEAAETVLDHLDRPNLAGEDSAFLHRTQTIKQLFDKIDGTQDSEYGDTPTTEIWEIFALTALQSGSRVRERAVHWYHNSSKTRMATFRYPFPFRQWPIVEFKFEHTSKRAYGSRGIAELLSAFQRTASNLHNARLDAAQIVLAPTFKCRAIGNQLSRNWTFRPGGRIKVNDMNDIEPIVHDIRPLMELLREEMTTKTLAEQLIGIFDPSLTQLQGTGRERRTATEVDAVVAQATEVHSMDGALFQLSMAKVHRQIWDLWEDFGPEEVYYNVLGEEQPKIARKADISGDYDLIPAGSPLSTNRALMLQRARELLTFAMQDQSFTLDKYEAWKEFLSAHGYTYLRRMLRAPEEVQVLQAAVAEIQKQNEGTGQ